ncbi:MAG: glycosyltransferase, partial [Candidatus Aenigmarchaeota archaeon]|nr:glycosyltransferase [Candidatus Aenigmarchaeota archaeon]
MKILVFTTVFPNEKQPNLGVFVRERMGRVAKRCEIKVIAPVPYFPLAGLFKEKYRKRIPLIEDQQGIEVFHPKFFLIPGIMKFLDGFFLYLSTKRFVGKIQKTFDFDLIDAHFAYPDGFTAVLLGRHFNKPVTITLRGTLNRLINYKGRRQAIRFALKNANRVFSVSAYLVKLAKSLGIDESKFKVIPNGVDTSKFQVLDKSECRNKLGISQDKKVIISVGALVERKGHHRVIE